MLIMVFSSLQLPFLYFTHLPKISVDSEAACPSHCANNLLILSYCFAIQFFLIKFNLRVWSNTLTIETKTMYAIKTTKNVNIKFIITCNKYKPKTQPDKTSHIPYRPSSQVNFNRRFFSRFFNSVLYTSP